MDKYNSKIPGFFCLWRNEYWAVTLGQTTYYSCDEKLVNESWKKHEDQHKKQWKEQGFFKFGIKYIYYSITRGYYDNPFERDARDSEKKI
jgi:hypothetical protein